MNCEFRDDALSGRQDKKTHVIWTQESDDLFMNRLHSHLDFSYLAIGLRGSTCTSNWLTTIEKPLNVIEHESILSEAAWTALTNHDSVDTLEVFGGTGGLTRMAICRKLITGPIFRSDLWV